MEEIKNEAAIDYMREAIAEAQKGIHAGEGGPFGCVIVKDGSIIGQGHNQVIANQDPTCHGEMMAIRDACKNTGSHDLKGCSLYTTAAPCPMCKGAILWANIAEVYYGCTIEDTDAIGFRDEVFYEKWNSGDSGNYGEMTGHEECKKLFEEYMGLQHELY